MNDGDHPDGSMPIGNINPHSGTIEHGTELHGSNMLEASNT